jgi:xylulokinase
VRGEVLGFAFEPTPVSFLPGGGAEQDPEGWWRALVDSARRVMALGLVPPERVVAVACSSTFSSTVAVGADGQHLGPALTWLDSRGAPHVRERVRGLVNLHGYGLLNLLRWIPLCGGGPTLSGKDDVAHLLWWQAEQPQLYARAACFLPSKDYLNLRLTGRVAASQDSITLFWVTDNRDAANVAYHDGLIRRLGLDRAKLPPIRRSTDLLGPLLPEVADALGLARGTPVVVGSADLQSACVGSGAVRDFEGHAYIGTSSWVLCHVPFKKTDVRHTIASLPSAIPGRWFCANEQDLAGGCLKWLAESVLLKDLAPAEGSGAATTPYAWMDGLVRRSPPGARGAWFTPWLNGEKSPVDDEALRGGWHGLSVRTGLEDLVRAVYEGVALNSRWLLGHVERFTGRRMQALNLIGGGAQSPEWCQIYADALDRPVRQVADPLQANARGAAFLAAVALGHVTFEQIPEMVRISRTFEPDPATRSLYAQRFEAFRQVHRRLSPLYRRLARTASG